MSYDTNDLRAMNLDALRKLAIKMGVSGLSKKKKDDVVSALKYRIDHPCKDNKILVSNRCQIPSDIKALSKADMEVIAASNGIRNVKTYNKSELAAKLKKLFECERGDYVNAFTEDCASKSPPPSVEESEPEDSGSEDSGSEPDTKAKCGLLASKIRKLIDEKIRDIFLNVNLSGLSDSERLEVVEWENNRDDGIRGLEELGCNLSDDEITELTDRYVNDYKQLSGAKRSFCGEVIDYIIDTISQTAFRDKYNTKDLDARDAYWEEDLTPLVDSVGDTLRQEIKNIGCYDITEEDKKNLIDKYEPIISRVFDDYFTKKYPYDSAKSDLRKTTTIDKSGADLGAVSGDWKMNDSDGDIPCESFMGKSSCEFEYGAPYNGVSLRRCKWNTGTVPQACEPLTGSLDERLRITLGQSKAEWAKRKRVEIDDDDFIGDLFAEIENTERIDPVQSKIEFDALKAKADEVTNVSANAVARINTVLLTDPEIPDEIKEEANNVGDKLNKFTNLEKMLLSKQAASVIGNTKISEQVRDIAAQNKPISSLPISLLDDLKNKKELSAQNKRDQAELREKISRDKADLLASINNLGSVLKSADPVVKDRVRMSMGAEIGAPSGLLNQLRLGTALKSPPSLACTKSGKIWDTLTKTCVDECDLSTTFKRGDKCLSREYMNGTEKLSERIAAAAPESDSDTDSDTDSDWD